MRRGWLLAALLLSLGVNAGLVGAWAYRQATRPAPRPLPWAEGRGPFVAMADRLELAGGMRERFLEQQRIFFALTEGDRRELEEVRRALRRELDAPEPDPERIDELLAASAELNTALDRAFVENVLATRELLGPGERRRFLRLLPRLRPPADGVARRWERGPRPAPPPAEQEP